VRHGSQNHGSLAEYGVGATFLERHRLQLSSLTPQGLLSARRRTAASEVAASKHNESEFYSAADRRRFVGVGCNRDSESV
jgi:hypothetical protein